MTIPEHVRLFFGAAYIILTLSILPLYCMIIFVFLKVSAFRKHSCYWIMSALGVHNCLVLIGVAGMGLRTVIGEPFTELVEKFLFAMHRFCLTGASHMACLLAFNRFCVLTEWFSAPKIFYATAITLDFAYICAQIGMFLTAYASVIYNAELATNYFDEDLPLTTYLDNFDCFLGLGIMTSALIMYVVIVAVLLLKRFSLTTIENRAPIASREVAIFIQSMAEFTFEICLLLNAITLVKFIPHVYWATGSFVIFCILGSGWMSPLMYLMMNKTLRKQLFALIKRMNLTKVSPSNLLFRSSSTSYRY